MELNLFESHVFIMNCSMKLFFLLLAGVLFIVGYINQLYIIALCGSVLYMLIQVVNIVIIMRSEKLSREGKFQVSKFDSRVALFNQLGIFLELVMFIFGVFTFIFFPVWYDPNLGISSGIIAIGQVIIWILSGFVGRYIRHVPIRMGFGGWYILPKAQ